MPRHLQRKAHVLVSLAGLLDGDDDGPKWVQVTREGDFPGYLGGLKPFAFKRADLEQMVANIKSHPAYAVDANGVATGRVIPWDFNHASEANPTTGDLPITGAPSQGWTMDMEVRNGADGKAELWALTQFLEPARTYVKAGQYLWASVSVAFNAINAETAQNMGALVTSIALTNQPVVEGMAQLVASKSGRPGATPSNMDEVMLRRTWFEAARNPADAISMMREMFALPETAGAAEVMAQVAVIQGWVESGTAPLGTNPEEMISNMRIILNLPALTPQASVLDEASKSIQALLAEQAAAAGMPASPTPDASAGVPEPEEAISAAQRRKENDIMEEFIKVLAAALGVSESDKAVERAVDELAQLRDQLVVALGLSRDGTKVILGAAKEGVDAKARLMALFEALEVQDPEAALAKVASTMEAAKKLTEVMPELEGLQADKKKAEEAAIESDVDNAIAASKLPATVRPALLLQRQNDPEGFAKAYPPNAQPTGSAGKQHLLARVATSGSTPLAPSGKPDAPGGGEGVVNLAQYPGRNPTACAKMHLAGTVANWDKLSNEEQFKRAVAFKQQSHVIHDPAAL